MDIKAFVIDLVKFVPLGLGYWLLCHKGVIPKNYSLPIALITGYVLGVAIALIENMIITKRKDRNEH